MSACQEYSTSKTISIVLNLLCGMDGREAGARQNSAMRVVHLVLYQCKLSASLDCFQALQRWGYRYETWAPVFTPSQFVSSSHLFRCILWLLCGMQLQYLHWFQWTHLYLFESNVHVELAQPLLPFSSLVCMFIMVTNDTATCFIPDIQTAPVTHLWSQNPVPTCLIKQGH